MSEKTRPLDPQEDALKNTAPHLHQRPDPYHRPSTEGMAMGVLMFHISLGGEHLDALADAS